MNQTFHSPDIPVFLLVPRGDLRFCAAQHCFHTRHRVVPTKAEPWRQLINGICLRSGQKKGDDAGRKNSAYCSTLAIKETLRSPVFHLRVRRPHFDRHLSATLEAGKLRARVNSVKSRLAPHGDVNRLIASLQRLLLSQANPRRDCFFCFPRTRAFLFSSQENFWS